MLQLSFLCDIMFAFAFYLCLRGRWLNVMLAFWPKYLRLRIVHTDLLDVSLDSMHQWTCNALSCRLASMRQS